eukprot:scaffold2295_cov354-Prasinococcus_capsulatus_cf.AAC.12
MSILAVMLLNLGTRQAGEASAYSVFNELFGGCDLVANVAPSLFGLGWLIHGGARDFGSYRGPLTRSSSTGSCGAARYRSSALMYSGVAF